MLVYQRVTNVLVGISTTFGTLQPSPDIWTSHHLRSAKTRCGEYLGLSYIYTFYFHVFNALSKICIHYVIHVHKTIQISQRWFFEKHICIYKYIVIHNFHYKFLEILYIGIDLFFHPTWLLGSKYKISHLLPTRQEADSKLKAVTGTSSKSGRRPSKGSFGVGSVIFGVDGSLGIPLKTKQTWLTKRGEERWSNNMFPKMHTNNGWFLFMLLNLEGEGG